MRFSRGPWGQPGSGSQHFRPGARALPDLEAGPSCLLRGSLLGCSPLPLPGSELDPRLCCLQLPLPPLLGPQERQDGTPCPLQCCAPSLWPPGWTPLLSPRRQGPALRDPSPSSGRMMGATHSPKGDPGPGWRWEAGRQWGLPVAHSWRPNRCSPDRTGCSQCLVGFQSEGEGWRERRPWAVGRPQAVGHLWVIGVELPSPQRAGRGAGSWRVWSLRTSEETGTAPLCPWPEAAAVHLAHGDQPHHLPQGRQGTNVGPVSA